MKFCITTGAPVGAKLGAPDGAYDGDVVGALVGFREPSNLQTYFLFALCVQLKSFHLSSTIDKTQSSDNEFGSLVYQLL